MNKLHDDTLRNARARLLARGAELRDRIRRVHVDLGRVHDPLPRDSADAALRLENDEVLEAIEASATAELGHVEHALASLDAGTFGRCETCGKAIEAERLAIVPHAAHCSHCEARG
jgi:DnaK suppressor protein